MIHGLLVASKDKGMTSHEMVENIRKLYHIKKAGHFGTLDPSASGVLLIGFGYATRFFNFYIEKEKEYQGIIRFGFATTTYDDEGEPLEEEQPVDIRKLDIPSLLGSFTGTIDQVPPPFSAKKFQGKPLYVYARNRITVEPKAVQVRIHRLQGKIIDEKNLHIDVITSSGTYIRSLAHDIGRKTGTGAHLKGLVRTRIGEFTLAKAHTLKDIEGFVSRGEEEHTVIPFESLLPEFSKIIVSPGGKRSVSNGMPLGPRDILRIFPSTHPDYFRIFDEEGKLLAVTKKESSTHTFRPVMVFSDFS